MFGTQSITLGGMPKVEASLNDIELLVICGGRR
ncbi:hypothetical protein AGR7B_Cc270073 [Agrobacterium deltaense RV3]|nr:hypothetical protein AGR7B_Cc270073 [Agrobacterium deltaense RV3]